MTTVNHWGKIVNSESPVTGVLSINSIEWDSFPYSTEICLTCREIEKEIDNDESLSEDEKEDQKEYIECDSSHRKIFGYWTQDEKGLYSPDRSKEYAAILNETTIQVAYSKHTKRGALCSPCYPGQVDLNSEGDFLGYTLPDYLLSE